jgi:hypothetical protein
VSLAQVRHGLSTFETLPQKPALPVVRRQEHSGPQETITPVVHRSSFGVQMPAWWATHVDLSFLPFLGFLPRQTPEQHLRSLPRHV